jgi:hypothetical protein
MFFNGIATPIRYSGPIEWLALNTPPGHVAVQDDEWLINEGDAL